MAARGRSRAVSAAPEPVVGELERHVQATLDRLPEQPEDVALRALALRYGRTIDESKALADEASALPYDPETAVLVARLRAKVDAHQVMVDLGPRLLAALDALQATPKSRTVAGRPAPAGARSKLAALRDEA